MATGSPLACTTNLQTHIVIYCTRHPTQHTSTTPSLTRNSLDCDIDFSDKAKEMCQSFKTRGHPDPVVIHNSKHRAQSVHPQSASLSSHNKQEESIPHTLTFHPHNISVKNIILKIFNLYQHDPTTAEIFSQPLLISYKRDTNLNNFLVKSTLKSDHQIGRFKCTRVRCPTRTKFPNLSELLPSPITSRAFPPMSSSVLPVPYAKKYTSAKRAADWVIVSANPLEVLRLTIKTLLNNSRDTSTTPTILKQKWRFVAFLSNLTNLPYRRCG